jgi:MFS transporter, FHS family, L-fucose permease
MANVSPRPVVPEHGTSPSYTAPLAMVTTLFFMWGFLTCLNDILVPHLKLIFDLSYLKIMFIQLCFFSAYFVFSLPIGKIVERIGYKWTMVGGLFTMGTGALLFIPAASVPSYPLFLGALIVLAAGITALQVSANPYVAVLGPAKTASSRLNLAQAFNSLGTTLAPYLGGLFILSAAPKSLDEIRGYSAPVLQSYRLEQAASVKLPYLILGTIAFALGIAIAAFKLPAVLGVERRVETQAGGRSILQSRHLLLGAVAIFVYVGAEVSIGSFLVNYLSQPNIGNISIRTAAGFVSFYWGGAMVGRFIGSALLQKVRTGSALGVAALVACLLVMTSMLGSGHLAMWTILLVGLFNSIMFPSIFTLGIAELGPLTGEGSGILIMAIVGGAIIPLGMGALADRFGVHHSLFLPAICYLYIVYYGLSGSRIVDRISPQTVRHT